MITKARLRRDIDYLAGDLPHRSANSPEERTAAQYVHERFTEANPDTETDQFTAPNFPFLMPILYYWEFLFVSVVAYWWPWVFFVYGSCVFLAYIAETSGYNVFQRFLPHFQTQNVVTRFHARRPERLVVVSAHLDSALASPATDAEAGHFAPLAHFAAGVSMVVILASCVLQGLGTFENYAVPIDLVVRGCACAYLVAASGFLFVSHRLAETTRGAADNASGVAVLLSLAEELANDLPENADVWLLATGSKETGLHGMRRFLATHRLSNRDTWFINVDDVGAGRVRYTVSEGSLYRFSSGKAFDTHVQEAVAQVDRSIEQCGPSGVPSDALLPLARGYRAITVTSREVRPNNFDPEEAMTDPPGLIDYETVETAAAFVEKLVRSLDTDAQSQPGIDAERESG